MRRHNFTRTENNSEEMICVNTTLTLTVKLIRSQLHVCAKTDRDKWLALFPSVLLDKYQDNAAISPWLLPSKSVTIRHTTIILTPLYSIRYWHHLCTGHKFTNTKWITNETWNSIHFTFSKLFHPHFLQYVPLLARISLYYPTNTLRASSVARSVSMIT
jgi:hypothetical protein